jgi:ectoine hydroxylase-related dioxygenase (phytanoyl-CoA dioxygenase family)
LEVHEEVAGVTLGIIEQGEITEAIALEGWAVTPPLVPQLVIDRLVSEVSPVADSAKGRGGVRNLLDAAPAVRELATSDAVRSVAEAVLGPHCFAVRAIFFDKTPQANWKVMWHQDLTIAVRQRSHVIGFGPWSEKEGVPHVQPPVEILERMLAVRVHLDDCGAANGPVRVLSGSHRVGRLSTDAIEHWRGQQAAVDCLVERGAILAFRPLLLHASSPAAVPGHRRVLHFEFASEELRAPLEWYSRVDLRVQLTLPDRP